MAGRCSRTSLVVCLVACVCGLGGQTCRADEGVIGEDVVDLPMELVRNGSFEETDSAGSPVGWRAEWGGYAGVTIDLVKGRGAGSGGGRALRLKSPTSPVRLVCFNRPLEVVELAGQDLVVSCFYRTKALPLADIGLVTYAQPFAEKGRQTPYLTTESYPLEGTKDWALMTWEVRCPEGAREAIISVRSSGAGEVMVDDVSVRPADSPVRLEPVRLGEVVNLPSGREVRLNIHNDTSEERSLRVNLVAQAGKARVKRSAMVKAPARGQAEATFTYGVGADRDHRLELALEDAESGGVYDTLVASVPPLLSGRVVEPGFRGTLVSSIGADGFTVEGRINASEAICSQLTLEADLGGAGRVARDGEGITRPNGANTWRLHLPRTGMLTGRYALTIAARRERQVAGSLALEVTRAHEREHETGYDSAGRLYVDGRRAFVNGIYNVNGIEELEQVASHGFNAAVVSAGTAAMSLVKRAQELGVMLIVYSPNFPAAGSGPELSFWEHVVGKYGGEEGVIGWHLLGKPDASLMPFSVFAEQQAEMAKIDTHHPTITLLSVISLLPHYAPACDIVAVEPQPVPALPVSTVADDLRAARRVMGAGRPVWAAVQAVGRAWLVRGGGLEAAATGRPPTGAEHRAMTFLALAHGAQGLLHHGYYFSRTPDRPAYYLPTDAPDLWAQMSDTNAAIARLAGVLTDGSYRGVTATEPVHVGAWDADDSVYVVAVNAEPHSALTTFEVPGPCPESLYRLGEESPVAKTESGRFTDELPAYGARIYVSNASLAVAKGEAAAG